MNLRPTRVAELLKRELGMLIMRDLSFEAPLLSVRAVDITPDLKRAHVFISALGTPLQKKEAIVLLQKNRSFLQQELSKRLILKYTPHLLFQLDESIERGTRILNLLDQLEEEQSLKESSN